jgi:hypothetical protein
MAKAAAASGDDETTKRLRAEAERFLQRSGVREAKPSSP